MSIFCYSNLSLCIIIPTSSAILSLGLISGSVTAAGYYLTAKTHCLRNNNNIPDNEWLYSLGQAITVSNYWDIEYKYRL